MKAYQAYGKAGKYTGETPKKAALGYFDKFPSSRKCDVIEGDDDGHFFTITYGRASLGQWPTSYKDVTKKTACTLPDDMGVASCATN